MQILVTFVEIFFNKAWDKHEKNNLLYYIYLRIEYIFWHQMLYYLTIMAFFFKLKYNII